MHLVVKILLLVFSLVGLVFNILAIAMSEVVVMSGLDKFVICTQLVFVTVTVLSILIKSVMQVKVLSVLVTICFLIICLLGVMDGVKTLEHVNILIYKFFIFIYAIGLLLSVFNIILEIKSIVKGKKSDVLIN